MYENGFQNFEACKGITERNRLKKLRNHFIKKRCISNKIFFTQLQKNERDLFHVEFKLQETEKGVA